MNTRVSAFISSVLTGLLAVGPTMAQTPVATNGPVTPIQHLVVIFQENISFDHYFGTYPFAQNGPGEPAFYAYQNTPSVNGLSPAMLNNNPNALNTANGTGANAPFRMGRAQAATADQGHNYMPEQLAYHAGLMDLFPMSVGTAGPPPTGVPQGLTKGLTMGYYDGNTVTAFWNYAQHYAMSDNSYGTTYGPSTPGAIEVISGQTNGVINNANGTASVVSDGTATGLSDINDADPVGDVCSTTTGEVFSFSGKNIGDLMNTAGVTWGWFTGGFDLTQTNSNGTTGCARSTTSVVTQTNKADYIPHHEPFQYYKSTANPTHARPSSVAMIGQTDAANHQYDMSDFYAALNAGNLPSVSYLKAPGFQDGHAGYSDPLDEQQFVVTVINTLMQSKFWANTAVVIAYDDSDGWYDHVMPPVVNQSATSSDGLTGTGLCGTGANALAGAVATTTHAQGRCGYGPRLPLMVISPYAKANFVDHSMTDQSSIVRFIEDNWLEGARIQGSFDSIAGTLDNMFNYYTTTPNTATFLLSPNSGEAMNPAQSASHANALRKFDAKAGIKGKQADSLQ